jgi:hypothetical protein
MALAFEDSEFPTTKEIEDARQAFSTWTTRLEDIGATFAIAAGNYGNSEYNPEPDVNGWKHELSGKLIPDKPNMIVTGSVNDEGREHTLNSRQPIDIYPKDYEVLCRTKDPGELWVANGSSNKVPQVAAVAANLLALPHAEEVFTDTRQIAATVKRWLLDWAYDKRGQTEPRHIGQAQPGDRAPANMPMLYNGARKLQRASSSGTPPRPLAEADDLN